MDPKEMGIQPTEVGNPTKGGLTVPAEDHLHKVSK